MGYEGEAKSATKNDFVLDQSSPSSGGNSAFSGFEDKRGVAISRMKIAQLAKNYADDTNTAQLKATAENFGGQSKAPIQRQGKSNLPDNIKSGVENLSGIAMDDVSVHYNSDKPATVQAHAYAQGTDIHVAPGQEKHLPHEAWHVVQQKQGRVKPTKQLKEKVPINDDEGLEREADVMGAKAIQGKFEKPTLLQRVANVFSSKKTAQLVDKDKQFAPPEVETRKRPDKDKQYDPVDDVAYNESDFNSAKYIAHLKVLVGLLKAWDVVKLEEGVQSKKKTDILLKWNAASQVLNATGIGLGVATAVTFTCVTAGAGGVAILGVLTAWQFGVAASGAGLGFSALKAVGTSEKPTVRGAAIDIGKEALGNGIGNADSAVGATTKYADTGVKIAGELALGTAASGLGAVFAAYGLKGDLKERADLKAKQKAVLDDLANFNKWLEENKNIVEQMKPENNLILSQVASIEQKESYIKNISPSLSEALKEINRQFVRVKLLSQKVGKSLPPAELEGESNGTKI